VSAGGAGAEHDDMAQAGVAEVAVIGKAKPSPRRHGDTEKIGGSGKRDIGESESKNAPRRRGDTEKIGGSGTSGHLDIGEIGTSEKTRNLPQIAQMGADQGRQKSEPQRTRRNT